MFGITKKNPKVNTSKILDNIEKAVYMEIKPYGFQKHGRTLHRFVSEDISQLINFQVGQAYRGETHLLFVNVGIRVPECALRSFEREETPRPYYHNYDCNMRSWLGTVEGRKESCYDLRKPAEPIIADILRQIRETVIPVFDKLNSRDAILEKRRDYPQFDVLNRHLILLEEAMIYGRRGEREKAAEVFQQYYQLCKSGRSPQKDRRTIQSHLQYLDGLAAALDIEIQ